MPPARELHSAESPLAAAALLELRPQLGSEEALVAQVEAQRAAGYRLVASFEDGDPSAAAVAGFRIGENLAWGRFAYVDDLVTRAALRGRGHADAVLAWVEREARSERCAQLHLDSGVGPERADAHRFYFRHRLRIASYHFARELGR
jgi:GNAT superfamily N-acetyltransferase